jgi:hypothetical protein
MFRYRARRHGLCSPHQLVPYKSGRKSAKECRRTVDAEPWVRRSHPGSEALKERHHKLSAPRRSSISKCGVGSTREEESEISAGEDEHTNTHVNRRHLIRTTSRKVESHAIQHRAQQTSRPRHLAPSLRRMMAALEEPEIEPDPLESCSVAIAPCYSTPPPTP